MKTDMAGAAPTRGEPVARRYEAIQVAWDLDVSYADFTRTFESLLGRMDAAALSDLPQLPRELARTRLASFVGPLDFTLFQKLDHGAIVASLYGRHARAMTYVFGNALIAVEMTKHVLRAGLYVPLRLFVEELGEAEVRVTYDLPSSLIGTFGSAEADIVARGLDQKVERLVRETLDRARAS
jgi:uncharacterized protein (DUF302 family)